MQDAWYEQTIPSGHSMDRQTAGTDDWTSFDRPIRCGNDGSASGSGHISAMIVVVDGECRVRRRCFKYIGMFRTPANDDDHGHLPSPPLFATSTSFMGFHRRLIC